MTFSTNLFIQKEKEFHIGPNRIDLMTKLSKQLEILKYSLIPSLNLGFLIKTNYTNSIP